MTQLAPFSIEADRALAQMAAEPLDVLVIGGGITGVSVALDAASRGLRVGLVEREDFASGTSSASSKMIHGGLRYIEQREFRLVHQSLLERQRMYRRAPHLVSRLPFLFPIYRDHGIFGPRMAKAFEVLLWTYDALGGWRIGRRHRRISAAETLAACPTLRPQGLLGGLLYFDCRTDDARLTVTVARTAGTLGALVANHTTAVSISPDATRHRVRVRRTTADGSVVEHELEASVVVNAGGVWSDQIAALADPDQRSRIRPAKGVHLVVPWHLVRSESTLTFPIVGNARGKGGKGFVLRWGDHCYIGTTDTPFDGDLDHPRATAAEALVLIESLNAALTTQLTLEDITGGWAGLRPLIDTGAGDTSELSREHEITVDGRVVTVAGGKLTVARAMAQLATDRAAELLGSRARCRTAALPLVGGAGFDAEAAEATGGRFGHLSGRYGTEARFLDDLIVADPALGEPVVPQLPYCWAEVVHAIRHEGAQSVDDVLSRRLPVRFLEREAAIAVAPRVGEVLARELGLDGSLVAEQVRSFSADLVADREALQS